SKKQQQELFQAFSRGSSQATISASGLGLGLSICRSIIDLHEGTIGVVSEEGLGSTFHFELPKKNGTT
ncbi:MAG TPA: ATP-binding protein, partial [Bacteriovoracaceae bacterium]|nr:ATP-binding protein [Bacteriovoracaceae bacterium]